MEMDLGPWGSLATEGAQPHNTCTHLDRHTEINPDKKRGGQRKKARPRRNTDAMRLALFRRIGVTDQ